MVVLPSRHPGYTPRRIAGLTGYERVLARAGLSPVAGIDEAGRGACAGPLVVAAVTFEHRQLARLHGVADSKALTAAAREKAYAEVLATALAWHVVVIPSTEIDEFGLHVCNIAGMRRALAGLARQPAYVLTDGFAVRGLGVPALAMWKGDEVAACVAAASVVAKVTRDRLMRELHLRYPEYGFARHKGYSTPAHMRALNAHGPCPEHRRSFVNVAGVAGVNIGSIAGVDVGSVDAGGVAGLDVAGTDMAGTDMAGLDVAGIEVGSVTGVTMGSMGSGDPAGRTRRDPGPAGSDAGQEN